MLTMDQEGLPDICHEPSVRFSAVASSFGAVPCTAYHYGQGAFGVSWLSFDREQTKLSLNRAKTQA